jgi:hypothetical protein
MENGNGVFWLAVRLCVVIRAPLVALVGSWSLWRQSFLADEHPATNQDGLCTRPSARRRTECSEGRPETDRLVQHEVVGLGLHQDEAADRTPPEGVPRLTSFRPTPYKRAPGSSATDLSGCASCPGSRIRPAAGS